MKYLLLPLLILLTTISQAAPTTDGALIKQEITNRITLLQSYFADSKLFPLQINLDEYQIGDKSSTASITVKLTSQTTNRVYSFPLKLNITHGPDLTQNNVSAKGLALVTSSLSVPMGMRGQMIPILQLSTIIDKDAPDWKINFVIPSQHIQNILNWDGSTGQFILYLKDSKITGSAIAFMMSKILIDVPGKLSATAMPIAYKGATLIQDGQNSQMMSTFTSEGAQVMLDGKKAVSFNSLNDTSTTDVKNNMLNSEKTLKITGVETAMLGEINSMPTITLHVQVKNIQYGGTDTLRAMLDSLTQNPSQEANKLLTSNSELDFDTNIETNLGNFTSSIKLTLNAMPTPDTRDFINAIDANVNVFISNKLLNAVVAMATQYKSQRSLPTPNAQSGAPAAMPTYNPAQMIDGWVKSGILAPAKDGYTISFIKQKQNIQLNGSDQNPYLQLLKSK